MSKINTIMDSADAATAELRKKLPAEAATAALAIALGRAAAESGLSLDHVLEMAAIANREKRSELDRVTLAG